MAEQQAESIRDILKRMANNKTSPTSQNIKQKVTSKPVPVPQETEEDDFEELTDEEMQEDVEETPIVPLKEKPVIKQNQRDQDMAKIIEKVRDLQDNGIYRIEHLGVLNEINVSLKELVNIFKG